MTLPLLTTKFNLPSNSVDFVPRPRLTRLLDSALLPGKCLALVCAPAGYGKTSLVSDWLNKVMHGSQPVCFAWLTLDRGDDDLARLISYLAGALQHVKPELGEGLLTAIQSFRPVSIQTLATLLINDLVKIPDRFILILDDYHWISSSSIHTFLEFLIEHQPKGMSLIIITRADPPIRLARLRARGQLVEIRQADLSFNLEETTEYLGKRMNLDLTSEQLNLLEKRTEGWVAALQLAGLSIRTLSDPDGFINNFSGRHEYIADYLAEEVLSTLPEIIESFLLQTSILERLSPSLCDAVTSQNRSRELLAKLRESNLFIIPLDYQQDWYRYHTLLSDLLRKRLYETHPDLADDLHLRASSWYSDQGFPHYAIDHALLGKDYNHAIELIVEVGEKILQHGEAVTLLRWLDILPEGSKVAQPLMFVYEGLASLMCGKSPFGALEGFQGAIHSGSVNTIRAEWDTLQATMAVMKGESEAAIRFSESALEQLPEERAFLRCLAADNLGMAYTLVGDIDAARVAFKKMVEISQVTGNAMMTLMGLSNLAGILYQQGKLRDSAAAYQRVLALADERFGASSPTTGKALLGLGEIHREWNDLDRALQYFSDALRMLEEFVEIGLPVAYLSIAMVKSVQGKWEAAYANLEKAQQYAHRSTTTPLDDQLVELLRVRFWIREGRLKLAQEWAQGKTPLDQRKNLNEALSDGSLRISELQLAQQLTLARLYLAKKQPDRAIAVLNLLMPVTSRKGAMRRVIEIQTLRSLAFSVMGKIETALDALKEALSIAEPESYQRTFLDEGDEMAQLLYRLLESGFAPNYVGGLLVAFPGWDLSSDSSRQPMDLTGEYVEALSRRELEVLALIAEGLSNREIAQRLHISLSTVKGHTSQIFGKLAVNSRTHAVAKARTLNLLTLD